VFLEVLHVRNMKAQSAVRGDRNCGTYDT